MPPSVGVDGIMIDTGAVQAHGFGRQVIDANPALEETLVQGRLRVRVAEHGQDVGETIIGTIGIAQGDGQEGIDGLGAVGGPVAEHDQAMVAFEQEMAEPDGEGRADAAALPMAMGRDMLVNQFTDAHIFHDADEQGQTVDLFIGNGNIRKHTQEPTMVAWNLLSHLRER